MTRYLAFLVIFASSCFLFPNKEPDKEYLWRRKHAVIVTPGIGEMIGGKFFHGSIVRLDDGTMGPERHGTGDYGVCLPGENAMVDVGIFRRSHKIGRV